MASALRVRPMRSETAEFAGPPLIGAFLPAQDEPSGEAHGGIHRPESHPPSISRPKSKSFLCRFRWSIANTIGDRTRMPASDQ